MNTKTYKVVYYLNPEERVNGRIKGVALVEGWDEQNAMNNFQTEYKGQYFTVDSCEEL